MLMCEYKGCGDKRKKCSAKVCVRVQSPFLRKCFGAKGNGVVVTRNIAKEEEISLCYCHITGVTCCKVCTRLLREFGEYS